MSISIPGADYTPQLTGYTGQGAFRFWCQKVLPIVYDDSLSYYELLNKVINYLNNVIADVANVEHNVGELNDSYISLQSYVNEHMQEIVDVVNEYTEFTTNYFNNLDVQEEINTKLDEMASDGSLSRLFGPIVAATAPDIITQWLSAHITPTTPIVDKTLTVSGAAADAKVTGEKVTKLKSASVQYRGVLNTTTVTPDTVEDIGYWTVSTSVASELIGLNRAGTFFNLRQPPNDFLQMFITTKGEVYCRYQKTGAFDSYSDFTRGTLDGPDTTTAPGFYYSDAPTTAQYTGVSTGSTFLNMATDAGTVYLQAFILPGGVIYSRYGHSGSFSAPAIDKTLKVENAGADSKAVGDALSDIIAENYDPVNGVYSVGDYCLQLNKLYRCIYNIDTPETWNTNHWSLVDVGDELTNLNSASIKYRGVLNTTTTTPDTVEGIGYWTCGASNAGTLFGLDISGTFFNLRQPPNDFLQMFITVRGEVYCRYQKTGEFVSHSDFTRGTLDDPDTTNAPGFYYSESATTRQYTGVSTPSAFLNMTSEGGTVYSQAFILPGGVIYSRFGHSGAFSTFTPAIPHRQVVFAPDNPLEFTVENNLISVTIPAGYYILPEYSLGVYALAEDVVVSQTNRAVYQYAVLNAGTRTFSVKGIHDTLSLDDIVLFAFYKSEILNISVESSKFRKQNPVPSSSAKSINDFFAGMFNRTGTPFKIVLGGDSITHGVGGTGFSQNGETIVGNYKRNPDGYCWANLFKSYIEANYNASVLNNGVTGTYSWWWNGYKSTLIPAGTDLFILTLGTNQRIKNGDRNGTTHDEQLANYYTQMKSILEYCASINVPVLLCSSIPATAANEEQSIDGEPLYPSHVFEYNGVLQRLASEYNMAYFNLYDAIYYYVQQNNLNLSTLLPDGLHPNDEMYRIMFYEYLKGFNLAPSYVPVELPNQGG